MKSVRSWDGCKPGVSPPRWSAADPRGIAWIPIRATPCIIQHAPADPNRVHNVSLTCLPTVSALCHRDVYGNEVSWSQAKPSPNEDRRFHVRLVIRHGGYVPCRRVRINVQLFGGQSIN